MGQLLEAKHLSKTFVIHKKTGIIKREKKEVQALVDINLEIQEPIILGLVGPNGAGKTTFIKHCLGLVEKTEGSLTVLGHNPYERKFEFLKHVGLVSGQKQNLDPNLAPLDSLKLSGYLYEMQRDKILERIDYLVDIFNIRDKLETPVRQLSLGQRMKFEIISSVLHSPKFLFMDEPSIGLDFESQSHMRDMLLELHHSQKLTILLTSHYLPDITTLCSRVAVIEKGRIVFDGNMDSLLQHSEQAGYLQTLITELNKNSHTN
jgi:ABC-2 type transport system ATP-binding protein